MLRLDKCITRDILTALPVYVFHFKSKHRNQINSVGDTATHHCGRTSLIRKLANGFLTHLLPEQVDVWFGGFNAMTLLMHEAQ